ncbi:MAG: oligoendopeptidase F family protein [Alphaproteobacteria bacterium]|nr:oligoendopeptidase F family protein [Alphaproteobacteria bacterium]MCB9698009.1 oligoendopeptidase F family protein [Alphaproteobacteria bacterium]
MLWIVSALAAEADQTWHLQDIYPSIEAFDAARAEVDGALPSLAECRGQLGKDASTMLRCLKRSSEISAELGRLSSFTSNHVSADTRDDAWQARSGAVNALYTKYGEATAWMAPEIVALGQEKVEAFLAAEPALRDWDYPLHRTIRQGEHVLSPGEERVLALSHGVTGSPSEAYVTFANAELPWPTLTLPDGTTTRLAQSDQARLRVLPDPATRKLVFDTYFGKVGEFEATFGTLLGAQLQAHWFEAQARGYDACVDAALDRDALPRAVYDTLVAQSNAHLPTLHRYLALRKDMLGLDELTYADLWVPLVESDRSYSLEESEALAMAASKPLGKAYVAAMKEGFANGWIDPYPRPGKVPGAYMSDEAWGVHPFVLLNHTDDYRSASTLAHEFGHAMHSHLASEAQPYPTASYPTFLAEVASTFDEALLLDHVLKHAKTDDERLFYLGSALEQLRGTFFRQAMFAEFELAIHEKVEAGEPLTGAEATRIYAELVRRYHGDAARIDDVWTTEWATIPHFYYDFYVFQYATSVAASALLADDVLSGKKGAADRFLGLLRAGGNGDAYLLLKDAGVDLATPAPYDALAARMDAIMDRIEAIRAKQR